MQLKSPSKTPPRASSPSKLNHSPTTAKPPALHLVQTTAQDSPPPSRPANGGPLALAVAPAVRFELGLGEGGSAPCSTAVLKGSWDSWKTEVPMRFNEAKSRFETTVRLTPALYQVWRGGPCLKEVNQRRHANTCPTFYTQYKFIVDGRWTTQSGVPEVNVSGIRASVMRERDLSVCTPATCLTSGWCWKHK